MLILWTENSGKLSIDTHKPITYQLISYAYLEGQVLLQLNYIIWFPANSYVGTFNMAGGEFDGITYRVTLDTRGEPLLYESMHNCGCYHQFYPTSRLKIKDSQLNRPLEEVPFIPQTAPHDGKQQWVIIRIEQGSHAINKIYRTSQTSQAIGLEVVYQWLSYNVLRSLPLSSGGHKSMFQPDSLVPGSQRLERFYLWPSGVYSPGAMRQFGHHACFCRRSSF